MKKIFVIIICLLVAFIPTYIAVGSYFSSQSQPVKQDMVDKLDILSPNGDSTELLRENDSDGFIEFMISMNNSAEKILALPEPLTDNPFFSLTYHSFDKATTYNYYFSDHSTDAYFVDPTGMAYHITKEDAERFLKTPYAFCVYENSSAPVMTVDSVKVFTKNANWKFKGCNDVFYDGVTENGTNSAIQTYGTPILSFNNEPDTLSVTLKSGDEVLYDGYYSELANHDFGGKIADAHIVATWYPSDGRNYNGELTYDLSIEFKEPPVFFISSSKATIGDIICISVLHAQSASDISFKSEPAIDFSPVFCEDVEYIRALIPVSTAYIPGAYKFSVDYKGHSPTDFNVDVTGRYTAAYPYNVEDSVFEALYTDSNIKAYNTLFSSFFDDAFGGRKFDGKFISGLPRGTFESADYCDTLTISKNSVAFENPGIYYSCNAVSEVKAVAAGSVIFAGNDNLAGNIVAVEHGLGLVSVYKHLEGLTVKAGDTVECGTVLGKSGRTGFMSKKGAQVTVARVELYVNKVPVDIVPLIEHGIILTK